MRRERPLASMEALCLPFGKTRQAWYKSTLAKESAQMKELLLLEHVKKIRRDLPRIGTVKLHKMLKPMMDQHQIKLGIKALNEVLRNHKLLVSKYKRRVKTTFSRHRFRRYKNLTSGLAIEAPNTLWVSDITYIVTGSGFSYLSLVTDAYSRKIVGWSLQDNLTVQGPLEALEMALKQVDEPDGKLSLIHHSDRGIQYCCHAYIDKLTDHKVQISMTQNGDPYENALAERVNGIIKVEILDDRGFPSLEQAQLAVEQAIKTYNGIRLHMSIDYLTPNQAHQGRGELKKHWKPWTRKEQATLDPNPTSPPLS